jgi:hypothetical protein
MPIIMADKKGGGEAVLIQKTITANGTFVAADDNADGYSSVTVEVQGGETEFLITNVRCNTASSEHYNVDVRADVVVLGDTLPSHIDGSYTSGTGWFYGYNVVYDKNKIKNIGTYAFQYSPNMQNADFPEAINVGSGAFQAGGAAAFQKLQSAYFPKLQFVTSNLFTYQRRMTTCQIGSVGYAVTGIINSAFSGCNQTGLTITVYTTGSYADTAVTKIRNGATNAAIIIKAAEATTYNGTSYAAGDTILSSEVT